MSVINCEFSSFKATPLNDQTIAFRLEGEFGKHLNKELRAEIMTALKNYKQNVIIDLTKVDNIDTSAAALLVECIRVSEVTNTSFKVVGINNKVKSIFEMLKLSTIFNNIELSQIPRTNEHILYRTRNV
ncbi:TPA: anti-sigma factor antagonist [Candidatus Poribacteria bacterium]|nr:anti-sigma factor antagonist [Candidatus Poribacteria bacterium]